MKMRNPEHVFTTQTSIALPLEQVFDFFTRAENLGRITPPELNFRILTPTPVEIRRGALIDYRLSLLGIPFGWRTEITDWLPPYEFVDTQVRGPYAQWVHRHRFREEAGGTLIEDEVRYRLPVPLLGELGYPLLHWHVGRIFRYRERMIRRILLPAEDAADGSSARRAIAGA
jgi:ligand-binding SRPBCC domain-containing protein